MVWKIIGAIIAIWLVFAVIGFVFKALGTLLLVAGVVTLGGLAYSAIKGKGSPRQLR
jgi:hypothetical protein